MTLSEKEKEALISYRLEQADETVNDVELLILNKRYRSAVNRIYYGMFYSLLAMGLAYNFETSKHSQLIGWFNKSFISTSIIEKDYGRIITKAFSRRTKGDYDIYVSFEKDLMVEMFADMKKFITRIKEHLHQSFKIT